MNKARNTQKGTRRKNKPRDYTKERRAWLVKVTPEECLAWATSGEAERILSEIKEIQAKKRKQKTV